MRLYCTIDRVAQKAENIAGFRTDGEALRSVDMAFAKYPHVRREDYDVLLVGEFDDSTGEIAIFSEDGMVRGPVQVVIPSVEGEDDAREIRIGSAG